MVTHNTACARKWILDALTALLWAACVESSYSHPIESERDALPRLVCELAPRDRAHFSVVAELARPVRRDQLAVEADLLMTTGEPLGEWIAAWLRGECPRCDGHPSICDHASGRFEGYGCSDCMNTGHTVADPCPDCHGHGVMLGAHVDAMVEMLDAAEAT